ncbi:hypothetical protein D3C86_2232370 [compost metagenome]
MRFDTTHFFHLRLGTHVFRFTHELAIKPFLHIGLKHVQLLQNPLRELLHSLAYGKNRGLAVEALT